MKDKFILNEVFSKVLNKKDFLAAKDLYLKSLEQNPYSMPEAENIYQLLNNVKRNPAVIGPYKDLTVFEALNRIGSDLVLLSGAQQLFDGKVKEIKPDRILLRMGNTGGFDFEVFLKSGEIIYGEAFNAAPSFCKSKMRQAIKKLMENVDSKSNKALVFANSDVKNILEGYVNKQENSNLEIVKVYCEVEITN
jgi:hypothetical protein